MNSEKQHRIFGLDLLRVFAILIVLIGHSSGLMTFAGNYHLKLPDGVDLFFVLSGYLIGSSFLRTLKENKKINFSTIFNFIIRRWFRTLPNYFLFLLLNVILIYYSIIPGYLNKFTFTFLFFVQNFHKPYDFMFWESWSLAIEEWFYLLFPLMTLFLLKFRNLKPFNSRKKVYFQVVVMWLIIPLLYRISQSSELLDTDLYFRKLVLTRFDTIAYGLLFAYIHFYYASFWIKFKNLLFVFGIILMSSILSLDIQEISFKQTLYFSIMSLSIALLIPKISTITITSYWTTPITYLSKISYAMYLVNLPIFHILENSTWSQTMPHLSLLMFWLCSIGLSAIIFRYYERPLMNLRDKIKFAS